MGRLYSDEVLQKLRLELDTLERVFTHPRHAAAGLTEYHALVHARNVRRILQTEGARVEEPGLAR